MNPKSRLTAELKNLVISRQMIRNADEESPVKKKEVLSSL